MEEGTLYDRKSLKTVWGKTADFEELAKDCVAFANSKGGCIHIGIEDGQTLPPSTQKIEQTLADKVESIPEIQTLRLRCREDEHLVRYPHTNVITNYPTTQKGRIALGMILNEKKLTAAGQM